jgi:putative ABC transport system permease protein
MFKNYLKIALRNLRRHKGYSFINITGLAVGMSVCILILLWIQDELSYDRFHKNADVICRVTEHQYNSSGDYFPVAVTPWPLAEALKKDFPEIVESCRLRIWTGRLISYGEKKFYEDNFVAVDPSFLKMFSFPVLKGDAATALTKPNTVLITREAAVRYFGEENPLGKVLTFHNRYDFEIVGILGNVPRNSHIKFDFLVPFESTLKEFGWETSWWTNNYTTYIQIADKASHRLLADKVNNYLKKVNPGTGTKLILQPLTDIHLHSNYAIDLYGQTQSSAIYVYAFSIIALLVLLIACINFMNLSTAQSERRSREVGLRKVAGASRNRLVAQFYGESIFLTFISFLIALLMVSLFLPVFNQLSGKFLSLASLKQSFMLLGLLGILLITGVVSGSYPALVLSSFTPLRSFKGPNLMFTQKKRKPLLRRLLVTVQFTLSIILIIGTLTVYKQIHYMLQKKLGYEKDSLVYFIKRDNLRTQYDAFKDTLLHDPSILGVTTSSDVPTYTVHSTGAFSWEGKNPETHFLIHQFSVDFDYIKTFGMNLIAGRDFSKQYPTDALTQSFIVNETAVKAMGLKNPIGAKFSLYENTGQIIGVVGDFHYKSMQKEIEPLVFRIEPQRDSYVFVKLRRGHSQEAISAIRKVHDRFNPEYPLEYKFLDESVGQLYLSEQKTKNIFNNFTFIAIIISCLGLYGLSAYMAQRKTKEIGVRKVLGASNLNILSNLSIEFIILVGVSNLIAWPAAYLVMKMWLKNFAYRTTLSAWTFILSGMMALVIALLTVSYQSLKVVRANPVESLRHE